MILEIIILILAIPAGYLIAWLSHDELKAGRKWFKALVILSIILGLFFYLIGKEYAGWTMAFVFIVSLISLVKSKI